MLEVITVMDTKYLVENVISIIIYPYHSIDIEEIRLWNERPVSYNNI